MKKKPSQMTTQNIRLWKTDPWRTWDQFTAPAILKVRCQTPHCVFETKETPDKTWLCGTNDEKSQSQKFDPETYQFLD